MIDGGYFLFRNKYKNRTTLTVWRTLLLLSYKIANVACEKVLVADFQTEIAEKYSRLLKQDRLLKNLFLLSHLRVPFFKRNCKMT